MPDADVEKLRWRDYQKYSNPNGPAFDQLVDKERNKGHQGDDVYEAIIDSSQRTNADVNKQLGVGGPGRPTAALPPRSAPKDTRNKPEAKANADVKSVKDETKALKDKTAALKDNLKSMQDHEGAHKKMTSNVGKSPKSFTDLTKAIKDSSAAQKNVQGATKSWIGSHGKLNASMLKSPLGLMVTGITAAIGVVTLIITHWDTVHKAFETVKKTALDPVGDFFQNVFASATAGFKSVTEGISNSFSSLGSGIEGVFKTVIKYVAVIVNAIGSVLQKLNIQLPDWLGGGSFGWGGVGDVMVAWAATRMATGGVVRGPGGPRDDRVPIMASNGEFVVNAASTARNAALLEAINNDTLHISGRDLQVMAVRRDAFGMRSRALPSVVNSHHFDHSTTINLTTHHLDTAHARAKTLAAQREVAVAWQ